MRVMPINSQQLSTHLKKGLQSQYTVTGDEALLVQESLDLIRTTARSQGFTERTTHVVSGPHFDWGEVLASSGNLSLFADRHIVEIRIPGGKPGKEGSVVLQRLAERSEPHTLILVVLPKLDRATKATAWFQALERRVVVEVHPVERSALPAWIEQRLGLQGQCVRAGVEGQRTLQFFADRVEGNLLAAHQEIQKIALLYPQGELSFVQVEAAVLNVARYDVFKLSEAVWSGQVFRVQRMLEGLQAEGESEVLVHYVLAEDVRILHRVSQTVQRGRSLPPALREHKVWGVKEQLFAHLLPRLNGDTLASWLLAAHHVDAIVKGLPREDWPQDPWQALLRLAMVLCKAVPR